MTHTAYLVVWPDDLLVKAGYSERRRWRAFVNRKAQVRGLCTFLDHRLAFDIEKQLHAELTALLPLAFDSAKSSIPYLGNGGSGWLEVYRADSPSDLENALNRCDELMRHAHA